MDGILHSIQSEPVYCLNYRFELSQMMDQIEQIKAENAARFTYLETLMIEKETELRVYEEIRALAEDKETQTDL